jgi:hypothetical protein
MSDGWIKLHRKFRDWGWYKKPETAMLFIELLLSANSKPQEWNGMIIQRGQVVTSRESLSRALGISQRSIRTGLTRLKSTSEVTIETTNKYSIITICNYDKYQSLHYKNDQQNDQVNDFQTTSKRPANDHKQEYKNIRSKEVKHIEISLPPDIDPEIWNAYLEMRKTQKKPLTEHAKKLILTKLETIGQDKNAVLNQSIEHSWIGVFALKDTNGTKPIGTIKTADDFDLEAFYREVKR